MPRRSVRLTVPSDELRSVFAEIRAELEIPESFPPEVLEEADASAADPRRPDADLTDVPFVTIDPPGSMDLDQAVHLEPRPGGAFRLRYAIADVAAFVRPGGAVDAQAHRRAETAYSPDRRSPLHPPVLSESAASLLPDGTRPAIVWDIDVDADGERVRVAVSRALVASRAKLDYPDVQAALDAGTAEPMLAILPRIGRVLQEAERARGGSSLNVPRQEVVSTGSGYALAFEAPRPVEGWNAQLSLLTGRAAAELMLRSGVGVLRTMPAPYAPHVERLRRVAAGLGIAWPAEVSYAELLHRLDAGRSTAEGVFLQEAAVLFQAPRTRPSMGRRRRRRCTRRWPRRTRTQRRRCGDSSIGTRWRCVSRSRPARRCRRGSAMPSLGSPSRCARARIAATGSSGRSSMPSRRRSSRR